MKPLNLPSAQTLHRLFSYDSNAGVLIRKHNPEIPARINKRCAGRPAGYADKRGYVQVGIGRKLFLAHRIIWKMVYGSEPEEIDHRDLDPSNNRIANLRSGTHQQNMCNRTRKKGKALPKGVFAMRKRFHAKLQANGRSFHLGAFATAEAASVAYQAAVKDLHGEYGRGV